MTVNTVVARAFLRAVGLGDMGGDHPFGGVRSREQFMDMVRAVRGRFPEGGAPPQPS